MLQFCKRKIVMIANVANKHKILKLINCFKINCWHNYYHYCWSKQAHMYKCFEIAKSQPKIWDEPKRADKRDPNHPLPFVPSSLRLSRFFHFSTPHLANPAVSTHVLHSFTNVSSDCVLSKRHVFAVFNAALSPPSPHSYSLPFLSPLLFLPSSRRNPCPQGLKRRRCR